MQKTIDPQQTFFERTQFFFDGNFSILWNSWILEDDIHISQETHSNQQK